MPWYYFYECEGLIVTATSKKIAEEMTGRKCKRIYLPLKLAIKLIKRETLMLFADENITSRKKRDI